MLQAQENCVTITCYLRRPEDADKGAVAIGWSELGVTRDHVMDRGGSRVFSIPPDPLRLYKQSSFSPVERYAQLNTVLHTY
jgi:hypothetical protein